jgi:hypothetical protein
MCFDYFNQVFQLVRNLKRKRKKELGLILKEHTELQIDRCGGKNLQLEWKPREKMDAYCGLTLAWIIDYAG